MSLTQGAKGLYHSCCSLDLIVVQATATIMSFQSHSTPLRAQLTIARDQAAQVEFFLPSEPAGQVCALAHKPFSKCHQGAHLCGMCTSWCMGIGCLEAIEDLPHHKQSYRKL